jgi:hypothetical protein
MINTGSIFGGKHIGKHQLEDQERDGRISLISWLGWNWFRITEAVSYQKMTTVHHFTIYKAKVFE